MTYRRYMCYKLTSRYVIEVKQTIRLLGEEIIPEFN